MSLLLKRALLPGLLLFATSILAAPAGGSSPALHATSGVVESIASDHHQATIHNQAIPGYMAEMTMDFPVRDTNELNGISPGDKITFTVAVTKDDSWIQNVRRTGQTVQLNTSSTQAAAVFPELKPGDLLPDGVLTAEDGRKIHFSDFRGQALAFTFFYTRCPLPNFCPLMNRNFAAARDIVYSNAGTRTNWQFLSVSFDAEHDTPQVLTTFGDYYRHGESGHWLFAAAAPSALKKLAPALDLMVAHQGSTISHNLRTVVLDTQGRIYRQFDGNQWTPVQLADAMLGAATNSFH